MSFHVSFFRKSLVTVGKYAFVRFFTSMCHNMGLKGVSSAKGGIANIAFKWSNIVMSF